MRRSFACLLIIPFLAGAGAGCGPTPSAERTDSVSAPAAAPLSAADEAAIHAADSTFGATATAGDVDGVVGVYADDATLLPPNAPAIKGTTGIREYWAGFFKAYDAKFELQTDQMDGRGDLAYVVGSYTLTAKPRMKGAPAFEEKGKFVEVLRRQEDGSWRYAVDIYNSDSPSK